MMVHLHLGPTVKLHGIAKFMAMCTPRSLSRQVARVGSIDLTVSHVACTRSTAEALVDVVNSCQFVAEPGSFGVFSNGTVLQKR